MKALKLLLQGVANLAPPGSTRPLREPLHLALIEQLFLLIRKTGFDIAWWACLFTTFWLCSRLGEFTVKRNTEPFNPCIHISQGHVSNKARDGAHTKDFALPWSKAAREKGEHIFWATQDGVTHPLCAFVAHLAYNNLPKEGTHLCSYPVCNAEGHTRYKPMRCNTFLQRLKELCDAPGEHTVGLHWCGEWIVEEFDMIEWCNVQATVWMTADLHLLRLQGKHSHRYIARKLGCTYNDIIQAAYLAQNGKIRCVHSVACQSIQHVEREKSKCISLGLAHGRVYNTLCRVTESNWEGRVKLCMGWDVSGVWDSQA
jgi:hypothetical protein